MLLRLAILVLVTMSPSLAFGAQRVSQFAVGITITGNPSQVTTARKAEPAKPVGVTTISFVRNDPAWTFHCFAKYGSFDPATGTYLGSDGRHYLCQ